MDRMRQDEKMIQKFKNDKEIKKDDKEIIKKVFPSSKKIFAKRL